MPPRPARSSAARPAPPPAHPSPRRSAAGPVRSSPGGHFERTRTAGPVFLPRPSWLPSPPTAFSTAGAATVPQWTVRSHPRGWSRSMRTVLAQLELLPTPAGIRSQGASACPRRSRNGGRPLQLADGPAHRSVGGAIVDIRCVGQTPSSWFFTAVGTSPSPSVPRAAADCPLLPSSTAVIPPRIADAVPDCGLGRCGAAARCVTSVERVAHALSQGEPDRAYGASRLTPAAFSQRTDYAT